MTVTIKDIAKKVGVNPSTVSRVINGTASISEETKNKILEAMKEMDYHPNILARSLVNGSTFTIGLVIDAGNSDAFSNAFFIRSVSAIETVTQQRGYNLLITNDSNKDNENAVKNLIHEKKVDGVILPISVATDELLELLIKNEFPFVVMGEPEVNKDKLYWVDMDNEKGGEDAVNHLIQSGCEHLVFLVENKGTMFEKKRIKGFQNKMEQLGISWRKENVIECGQDMNQIGDRLKKQISVVDGVICTNNIVAYHVLKTLKEVGKSIPEDVGVITFDNYPLAEYMDPPLTVIDVDTYKMGEEAAQTLLDMIKGKNREIGRKLLPTRVIERESTKKGDGR